MSQSIFFISRTLLAKAVFAMLFCAFVGHIHAIQQPSDAVSEENTEFSIAPYHRARDKRYKDTHEDSLRSVTDVSYTRDLSKKLPKNLVQSLTSEHKS